MKPMRIVHFIMMTVLAGILSTATAQAEDKKLSLDDIKSLTIKAADFIAAKGIVEAEKAFTQDGDFKFGEIYVNVIDTSGKWVVYPPKPENKGKSILNFIDEDGKKLGEDILNTGKAGEGWTEYRWKNPGTNTIRPKVTYVKKVPGLDYIAYVGIYK